MIPRDLFEPTEAASEERFWLALAAAEAEVSRADERLAADPHRTGVQRRLDVKEGCAIAWSAGALVSFEALALHDQELDVTLPDADLRAAHRTLLLRRRASRLSLDALLEPAALAGFIDRRRERPPSPLPVARPASAGVGEAIRAATDQIQAVRTDEDDQALAAWLGLARAWLSPPLPLLVGAALALESWRALTPLGRREDLADLVVNAALRSRRRVRALELPLALGRRRLTTSGDRRPFAPTLQDRLAWHLRSFAAAAREACDEQAALSLARQVCERRLAAHRRASKAPAALAALLDQPVVTAESLARAVGLTPHGARLLLRRLGASVTEISGRSRFRVWRLAGG
ncbi:DUF1612 domain-containing protein [Phenylobacterium sp.]|uniref:DUF1612 domain-containing protein n=1 Tax=Phenylobacterium sp. TaxID=1871053 RepID=UPI0035AD8228